MSNGGRNPESWQPQPGPSGGAAATPGEIMARQAVEAGALLRQLRQSARVDLMLLASALKVTPQKIQALEAGRLDDLPGLTFARGLAGAICRYFAADPRPVLALMPLATPVVPIASHAHDAFSPTVLLGMEDSGGGNSLNQPRRPAAVPGWLLAVVAVLLIAALAIWLAPGQWFMSKPPQVVSSAAQPAPAASAVADAASAPVAEPASAPEPPASPAADAALPSEPASSAVASVVAPATEASAPPAAQPGEGMAEQDVVTFNATGRVWLGVKDGNGKTVIDRILKQGDTLSVGGQLPLSVTVGNKMAVTVTVRGQPFDLNEHTRNGTVARFTVDPVTNP